MRVKSHVGCCYLLVATEEVHIVNNKQKSIITKVTKKAIFKSAYLTPDEKAKEEHFREILELKKSHKHHLFKD